MTLTRLLRALAPAAAILIARSPVEAQRALSLASLPVVVHSTHWAVIPNIFAAAPGTVAPSSLQADLCNAGACFDAPVTVQANTKWQLQVTVGANLAGITVSWVEAHSPFVTHALVPGVYQPVASGATTLGQSVALVFTNTTTATGVVVPTAAQLASVLSYRVIAAP